MSTVADLKKKFEVSKKVALTPEQHAAALRQKERDQQEAVRIAKARAARYNMTLRSLELANAAQVTQAKKEEHQKKQETKKSFQQPGRRVSGMKHTAQAKVEASQTILASALSHERNPKVAMDVVQAVAAQVEETLKTEDSAPNADDNARAKKEAEEAALAAAKAEELRLEEEARRKKELEEAAAKAAAEAETAAKAAAEAEAAAKAAEELKAKAAAAEAEAAAELQRKAAEEEAKALKAAEDAAAAQKAAEEAAAAAAAAAAPEATPEPAIDDGAKFQMTSLSAALDEGNDDDINKAIVKDFLQEHDPHRVQEVDKLMAENKGTESELMKTLVETYADPAAMELQVTAEVIVRVESEAKVDPPTAEEPAEDEDFLERQRKEAERIKLEEEAKIAAMDENERKVYMEKLTAAAKHNEEKDKMLKSQLNIYGSSGASALLGGRGRGRGKNRPKSDRQTEYIVNAVNEGGQWEVNTE